MKGTDLMDFEPTELDDLEIPVELDLFEPIESQVNILLILNNNKNNKLITTRTNKSSLNNLYNYSFVLDSGAEIYIVINKDYFTEFYNSPRKVRQGTVSDKII